MKPVIGILYCGFLTQGFDRQSIYVTASYLSAIEASGGLPVIIPYISSTYDIASYIKFCDGFLFCGGDDITPILFHEELCTDRGHTDQKTDSFHLSFMKEALRSRLPIFGICRGMQVLNLALGGTIYQDISLRPQPSLNHMQLSEKRSDLCHKISVSNNSLLCSFLGNNHLVNSFHHQAIKKLGKDLFLSAISSDGIAEAIEYPKLPFVVGVQWHPECLLEDESMFELFRHFIKESARAKTINIP